MLLLGHYAGRARLWVRPGGHRGGVNQAVPRSKHLAHNQAKAVHLMTPLLLPAGEAMEKVGKVFDEDGAVGKQFTTKGSVGAPPRRRRMPPRPSARSVRSGASWVGGLPIAAAQSALQCPSCGSRLRTAHPCRASRARLTVWHRTATSQSCLPARGRRHRAADRRRGRGGPAGQEGQRGPPVHDRRQGRCVPRPPARQVVATWPAPGDRMVRGAARVCLKAVHRSA